jgi:hypothetical protein
MSTTDLFSRALAALDACNAADPTREDVDGVERPAAQAFAERLTHWLLRRAPEASEPLRLAARSQHMERWKIPRDTYPATREGYLAWREALGAYHAERSAEVLRAVGMPEEVVARVQALNRKEGLATDPEMQALEDALCLEFLAHELEAFAGRTDHDKTVRILRRTWKKMSPEGRRLALEVPLGARGAALVQEALGAAIERMKG